MHRNLYVLLASLLPMSGMAQQHHQHGTPAKPAPAPAASAAPGPASVPAPATTATTAADLTKPVGAQVTGLESYKRFKADEPLTDWRAVNDTVRDIGGWRTYAQEAARAIKAEQAAKATTDKGRKP